MNKSSTTTEKNAKPPKNGTKSESEKPLTNIPVDSMRFSFELRPVARIVRKKKQAETKEKNTSQETIARIRYAYKDCMTAFSSLMCYLLEYMKQVGNDSTKSVQTNYAQMFHVLIDMLFEARQSKKKADTEVVLHFADKNNPEQLDVVFPVVDDDKLRSILQYHDAAVAAPKILAETMIQQIVNAWEHHLGTLLETKTDVNILKNNTKTHLSFSDIERCKDIFEVKKLFVERILRKFLGKNIDEQLSMLNSDYKIDFSSAFGGEHLSDLKGIIALRHAIVHCNSIATPEYCEKIRKIGKKSPNIGSSLFPLPWDLFHVWDVFFAAGMIVSHMFQVNHARQLKSSKMEDDAFVDFVTESHTALEQNRNEAALIMLRYASKLSIRAEWPRLATKINLALTYKRMGRLQECNRVLDECDWDTCGDQFKAAVAALRGNNKNAIKVILKLCRADIDFVNAAHRWVVFEDVRRDSAFGTAMQKLLSPKGKQMIQLPAPAIHFSQETDEKAMRQKLYEVALKFQSGQL